MAFLDMTGLERFWNNQKTYQQEHYTHPTYTPRTGKPTGNQTPGFGGTFTVSQITSDATGHVTGATDRTVKIPNTTATTSSAGLMSAADKTKLNGIDEHANAYIHPSHDVWNAASGGTGTLKVGTDDVSGGTIVLRDFEVDAQGHVTNRTETTLELKADMATTSKPGCKAKEYLLLTAGYVSFRYQFFVKASNMMIRSIIRSHLLL